MLDYPPSSILRILRMLGHTREITGWLYTRLYSEHTQSNPIQVLSKPPELSPSIPPNIRSHWDPRPTEQCDTHVRVHIGHGAWSFYLLTGRSPLISSISQNLFLVFTYCNRLSPNLIPSLIFPAYSGAS